MSTTALRRLGMIVVAAIAATAFAATSAIAASVSVTSGIATFTAGAGESNEVTTDFASPGVIRIADVNAITAGSGCTAVDTYTVDCTTDYAIYNLNDQADTFTGTGYQSVEVYGGTGNDTIQTGTGDSTFSVSYTTKVDGGSGDDTMVGGYTNDWHVSSSSSDGADFMSVGVNSDTIDYGSRTTAVSVTFDLLANDGATGEGDKVVSGTTTGLSIATGSGNDFIAGTDQADTITPGDGNDMVVAIGGDDTVNSGNGDDTVIGGEGNDSIDAGAGTNFVFGDGGNDSIDVQNSVNDSRIYCGGGSDTLYADLSPSDPPLYCETIYRS